jgi:outer membrane receptor protein involved in Fe transport
MWATRATQISLWTIWCVLASGLPAMAQGLGAIGGIVTDGSGGVLPGVTVKLASADGGTVGGAQEQVTSDRGTYEFVGLVSGRYHVRAELSGFRTTEQQNVQVQANVTTRADLKMEVGALEETVTVSGASPLVDVTTVLKQTLIPREELDALPNRTDVWSMARIVPSVVIGKVDVGGTERFLQSTVSVRGSNGENKYVLDNLDSGGIAGTGAGLLLYFDPFIYEEFGFQAGSNSAENSVGGVTINMVTRTGTNRFRGTAMATYTPPAWANSVNYSDDLKQQLLSTVPPSVLAANPDLEPQADILRMRDLGVSIGGPILPNRLWFATSFSDQRMDRYKLGNYDAEGNPVLDDNIMYTLGNKLSWQMLAGTQLSWFYNFQHKLIGHRGGGLFGDDRARQYSTKYPSINQVKLTSAIRNNLSLDVGFNRLFGDDIFGTRPEVKPGDVATFDSTTQVAAVALPTYNTVYNETYLLKGTMNWYIGDQTLTAGIEKRWTHYGNKLWSTSGMRSLFASGVPTGVNTYLVPVTAEDGYNPNDVPQQYDYHENTYGYFAQYRWRPSIKWSINAGLRYETQSSYQDEACRPETAFFPGACFEGIEAPSFGNFAPRFNMVYDVRGDGKTAVKLAANRYNKQLSVSVIQRLSTTQTVMDQRQWLPQARCGQAGVLGCDRNGDLIPQLDEIGPSPGYVFPANNARYTDDVDRPIVNEYSVGAQHELIDQVVLSAEYVIRQTRREIGQENTAVSLEAWGDPINVTEVTSGQPVQVWRRPSAASAILYFNDSRQNTDYQGVDVTINKRMSNGWFGLAGATFGKITRKNRVGNISDPHIVYNFDERAVTDDDRPWSLRLSGGYDLPWQLSLSGTWQYQEGAPETTTVLVTNQTIALPQGNQTVWTAPPGDVRYPNVASLDLTLRRNFRFGDRSIAPRIQFFNVLNNATIDTWVTQLGPTYQTPSNIQRARLINFDVTVTF